MSALLFDVFVEALHIAVNEDREQTHFWQFQTGPPAIAEAIHRRRAFEKELLQEVSTWSCWCCPAATLEGLLSPLSSAGVLGEVALGTSLELEISLEQHLQACEAEGAPPSPALESEEETSPVSPADKLPRSCPEEADPRGNGHSLAELHGFEGSRAEDWLCGRRLTCPALWGPTTFEFTKSLGKVDNTIAFGRRPCLALGDIVCMERYIMMQASIPDFSECHWLLRLNSTSLICLPFRLIPVHVEQCNYANRYNLTGGEGRDVFRALQDDLGNWCWDDAASSVWSGSDSRASSLERVLDRLEAAKLQRYRRVFVKERLGVTALLSMDDAMLKDIGSPSSVGAWVSITQGKARALPRLFT
ncbi:unnamed protein product [Symbiodinium natans]|uniref:SAM domain-containing protein n=1 Tax=Symbiodinium natans TaxID=878477 RepID=A0A812KD32_9DINO|nr:unnamed protein product [Symbiodinium natans]